MTDKNPYESPSDETYPSGRPDPPQKNLYSILFDHLSPSKQIVFWIIIVAWTVLAVFGIASEYGNN